MPRVTFIMPNGAASTVEARSESSLMEAAIGANIGGIEAECYGASICGTCHVYVDPAWHAAVGPRNEWEGEVLETLPLQRENSRLSCQIIVRENLDGLVVHLPDFQGQEPKSE